MNYITCELCGARWPMRRQAVLYSFAHDKMICYKCNTKSDPAGGVPHPPVAAAPAMASHPAGSLNDAMEAALIGAEPEANPDDAIESSVDLYEYITGGDGPLPEDDIPF